jgi:type IV pilus assembly protein PilA
LTRARIGGDKGLMNAPPYPAAPPPQPPTKKGMPTWAIILICTAGAFVFIVPILAVLGVYGVRKYIANAKTAEARMALATIAKDAATTYEPKAGFCASAHPVPRSAPMVQGKKYQSAPADWGTPADKTIRAGFACLEFSLDQPQYYQYTYTAPAPLHDAFTATAHGDLDGNGTRSTFEIEGAANAGTPSIRGTINETSPEE